MPLLRAAMYAKGVEIYCAPTADARATWLPSMRHIAQEGRCFVLSANQFARRKDYPADYPTEFGDDPQTIISRGGSCIIGPLGEVLAGPDFSGEAILTAEIDLHDIARARMDFDAVGHYARPDIFQLHRRRIQPHAGHVPQRAARPSHSTPRRGSPRRPRPVQPAAAIDPVRFRQKAQGKRKNSEPRTPTRPRPRAPSPQALCFRYEFFTTIFAPWSVKMSQPFTSTLVPALVVPVNVHSDTARLPATKWRGLFHRASV